VAARIGIDVTSALTQGGGIGRYTRELIAALASADTGYEYHFFAAKPPPQLPVPDPVPSTPQTHFHAAPLNERWLYRLWYRLRLPLPVQWATGRLDLFHSPDFVLPPVRAGIPTLLTVHDLSFLHYPQTFPEKLVAYLQKVVPWSVERATHVLADSQATKDDLLQMWQVPAAKVTVLYSGVHGRFQPVTAHQHLAAMRRKYHLGAAPYILAVGTVQPRKNYQMLIQAFAPIAAQYPHQLVFCGGKGWLYAEVLAEVARQGLDGRVHFIGFVDDDDLPSLYSDAALFVFPSLYEGFGLPILEAMACGVPVISSAASSLPEVVGPAGRLLSPHDARKWTATMLSLLADPQKRSHMVGAGFQQARRFTWQRSAKQLLEIYAALLAGTL
jgi:glycosyltransferase involved in cell wall biosynthesis